MRVLRGRRLQHGGAEGEHPPAEPARLLQAARGQGRRDRACTPTPGQRRPGRHQAQVRGAEPQPDFVRRRRVAVRRVLRPAVVPDVELPGPRRDVRRQPAEGLARAAVPGVVQRAVPVRSADHRRRRRRSRGSSSTRTSSRRTRPAATSSSAIRSRDNTRFFVGYSYEKIQRLRHQPGVSDGGRAGANPILRDSLLLDQGGRRTVSKITPSVVYNTVNQPIFPTAGKRLTGVGGLGRARRQHQLHPRRACEGIWYIPLDGQRSRTSLGLRAEGQWIRAAGRHARSLPIFEKFFLGGEYSVRGFDMRTIGPRDPLTGIVTGGNKSLLFNGEFYINIGGPGAPAGVLRRRPGAGHRRAVRLDAEDHRRPVPPDRGAALRSVHVHPADAGAATCRTTEGDRPGRPRSRRRPASRCASSCRC